MKKTLLLAAASLVCCGTLFATDLNVGELDINFCNTPQGGNKLALQMDMNSTGSICMQFQNLSTKPGMITMGFVDGEMSQGETSTQACKTDAAGFFGKSVTLEGSGVFTMGPRESLIKTGHIKLPQGFAGNLYGCITYSVLDDTPTSGGQMFSVISRKANTIVITVSGEVKSDLSIEGLQVVRNGDGSYTLSIKVNNNGTATEMLDGVINLTNSLGTSTTLSLISGNALYAGDSKNYSLQIPHLPWYGGQYTATVTITHQPMVSDVPQGDKGTSSATTSFSFGIGQYGLLPLIGAGTLGLILIIWLIKILFRKKKKKNK